MTSKRLTILEIIPSLDDGGAERFIIDLSNQIGKERDYKVYLVSLFNISNHQFYAEEITNKIQLIQLGKKPGFDISLIFKLIKVLNRIRPNIIHTHLRSLNYLLPIIPFYKYRFIHTIHNDAIVECPNLIERLIRKIFFKLKLITPVTISKASSESYLKAYNNHYNVEIENGRPIVPKSILYDEVEQEINQLKHTKETKVFLNIARISKQKNQLLLVKVINELVKEKHNLILIIIGSVRDNEIYKKIESKKDKHIFLLGSKPNPIDYLYQSDAFCLSSLFEGMPITLIEAFQTGCIPICTPAGGIKNMIHNGYNGFLSEGFDEISLKQVIKSYLNLTESKKHAMSTNCMKTYSSNYLIDTTSKKYINLFKSL